MVGEGYKKPSLFLFVIAGHWLLGPEYFIKTGIAMKTIEFSQRQPEQENLNQY